MNHSAIAFVTVLVLAGSLPLSAQRGQRPQRETTPPPTASAPKAASATPVPSGATTDVINLNTATATQIATLPGIGPKAAELIVQYRQKNGNFRKVEEIMNVRGIGEKTFLKLKNRITVATVK
jgi:competence protein ComEA